MKVPFYKIIIWISVLLLLIRDLNKQIKKKCSKVSPEECKKNKRKIIAVSICILGVFTILPGLSWIPSIIITKTKGKQKGKEVLELTVILGIILLIIGGVLYVV
mgnify:CR=1 FL=1|jgi:hypothetical protein